MGTPAASASVRIAPGAPPFGEGRDAPWPASPEPPGPNPAMLSSPLTELPGIGPATAERAATLGIGTIGALLLHLPARHEDFADGVTSVRDLPVGGEATVAVELLSISVVPTRRRGLRLVRARVRDASGPLTAVWFNRDYLARTLSPGDRLLLRGKVSAGAPPQMTVGTHEVLGGATSEGLHTRGLVPVHPAGEALTPRRIRELVDLALPYARALRDPLPLWIRDRLGLPSKADAVAALHFPRTRRDARIGRRRLVLEELVVLQLGLLALKRREEQRAPAPALRSDGAVADRVRAALPFTLTPQQERTLAEIEGDLRRTVPMRRLLQGEVGSGKTVVAALAICRAIESDVQAALLVPTETLAEQHLRSLDAVLGPAGISPVLLTGRVPKAERERRLLAISSGTAPVVVGTQALLTEGVAFRRLGLVVVDEQHRFGVEQRGRLAERASDGSAHLLYMTATPIPRTLALTAFGDLSVSTIRGRPPGRAPVETTWLREPDRPRAYELIRAEVARGRQAYVICPRVSEGEEGTGRSAEEEAPRLAAGPLAGLRVGMAHGAQPSEERRRVMGAFGAGEIDVLVATTVVEVGIDVPNATVMVIEDADRFGLAQLHQLRGRVGRGVEPGACIVFGEPAGPEGARRLEALTQVGDGFRLAELDLEIRGEGSVMGIRQSGPTDLRFARLARDTKEIAQARHVAKRALAEDRRLSDPRHGPLRAAVLERFSDIPRLLDA